MIDDACCIDHCITCSDEGIRMRVERVQGEEAIAVCDAGRETVDVALVGPVAPGDTLLVHAKVALARLDEAV